MSSTFFDHLKTSGLLPPDQLDAVSVRLSTCAAKVVAQDLVVQGLLTPFQVRQLESGQPKGLVLGQYHILDELGRGGYGCVYKARHQLMNRIVALKVIAPERAEDSLAGAWFRREVLAATQLAHPNIVLAYDADEVDGTLFFTMEYIDGLNLDSLVRKRGPLPIGVACEMLLQAAKALQYAHEKGMVHRDIKPANLLVPRDAVAQTASELAPQILAGSNRPVLVKVVDFGLARLQNSTAANTLLLQNERTFVGTPAYVSPEQARNIHDVDIRSDLYSLGCTFYYALSGRQPFSADLPLQIIVQHLEKDADPIEKHRPETPTALASILRRLMAKKPEKRFQTPAELLGELGFFYSLDRSGLQKAIPRWQLQTDRESEADPSVITCTPPPMVCDGPSSDASNYPHTRVMTGPEGASDVNLPEPLPSREASPVSVVTIAPPPAPLVEKPVQPNTPSIQDALLQNWRDWTSVIDDLVAGRAPGLDDMAYRAVHQNVLRSCQSRSAPAGQTIAFQQMGDLVQPWLNLTILAATDRETLKSLQKQCQLIDEKLGAARSNVWQWAAAFVCLFLAAGAGFFFLQSGQGLPTFRMPSWLGLIERHPLVTLAVVLPAGLAIGLFILKRVLRRPLEDSAR